MFNPVRYAKYLLDENFTIIRADDSFYELTGYTKEDVESGTISQRTLLSEDYWEEYMQTLGVYMKNGSAYVEHPLRKKDGSVIYVYCFGEPYDTDEYEGRNISRILVSDISLKEAIQKEVEIVKENLSQQTDLLENVLVKTNSAVLNILYDKGSSTCTCTYCSKGTDDIFGDGSSKDFIEGRKSVFDFVCKEHVQRLKNLFDECFESHNIVRGVLKFIIDENEKWLDINCTYNESETCKNMQSVFFRDVTREKRAELSAFIQNRFLQILSRNTKDIMVEYYFRTDRIVAFTISEVGRNVIVDKEKYLENISENENIHKDDRELVYEKMKTGKAGESITFEIRYKLNIAADKYSWVRFVLFPFVNPYNNENVLIGRCIDISNEVIERQEIIRKSRMDMLTGLYNAAAAKSLIKDYIENFNKDENGLNALIIIDIDNFKTVNDRLGHLVGDRVLSEIGNDIETVFKVKGNIAGRIGGDEFAVLITNQNSKGQVVELSERICRLMCRSIVSGRRTVNISASVGIAFFGCECRSYEEIFVYADKALYYRKSIGKNGYTVFDENTDYSNLAYKSDRKENN